jgi:hypothetical protein
MVTSSFFKVYLAGHTTTLIVKVGRTSFDKDGLCVVEISTVIRGDLGL